MTPSGRCADRGRRSSSSTDAATVADSSTRSVNSAGETTALGKTWCAARAHQRRRHCLQRCTVARPAPESDSAPRATAARRRTVHSPGPTPNTDEQRQARGRARTRRPSPPSLIGRSAARRAAASDLPEHLAKHSSPSHRPQRHSTAAANAGGPYAALGESCTALPCVLFSSTIAASAPAGQSENGRKYYTQRAGTVQNIKARALICRLFVIRLSTLYRFVISSCFQRKSAIAKHS